METTKNDLHTHSWDVSRERERESDIYIYIGTSEREPVNIFLLYITIFFTTKWLFK